MFCQLPFGFRTHTEKVAAPSVQVAEDETVTVVPTVVVVGEALALVVEQKGAPAEITNDWDAYESYEPVLP